MVCRAAHLLRAVARDGFPGSVLSAEQWGGVRAGRVLQFHPPQGAEPGAGAGAGAGDEEVAETEGPRREEHEQESEPGAVEEAVLRGDLIGTVSKRAKCFKVGRILVKYPQPFG